MSAPWSPDMQSIVAIGRRTFELLTMEAQSFQPTILVKRHDGSYHTHLLIGPTADLVVAAAPMLVEHPIEWAGFTTDAYCYRHDGDPTPETIAWVQEKYAGNLQRYFEAGEPNVYEALEFLLVSNENTENVSYAYEREGGTINWLESVHQTGL